MGWRRAGVHLLLSGGGMRDLVLEQGSSSPDRSRQRRRLTLCIQGQRQGLRVRFGRAAGGEHGQIALP
jgi:hypothetical protein